MEKQYFYENDYYYSYYTKGEVEYKFFFFEEDKNIKSQLEFVKKHSINEINLVDISEKNVNKIINFIIENEIFLYSLHLQQLTLNDIDFLQHFQTIENLTIVVEVNKRFNFNVLKKLRKLELFMGKYFLFEDISKNISILKLHKVNSKCSMGFSELKPVKDLDIFQSTLTEINGLKDLKNVESLNLRYVPKLNNIEPIKEYKKLKHLRIKNCKNITDWEIIGKIGSLKTITIDSCGKIESLDFLENIDLMEFYLVDTQVEDGNVSWLLNKKITRIDFPVYKHYNITPEELWEYQRKIGQRKL